MKDWIIDKLGIDKFWFSYWPNIFILALNAGMLTGNLYSPPNSQELSNALIFAGSIGIAFSMKNLYKCYLYRKELEQERAQFRSTMDKFMNEIKSDIQAIMEYEMTVPDRDEQESLQIAQEKILFLIQSESERRKIGLTVSSSDKT